MHPLVLCGDVTVSELATIGDLKAVSFPQFRDTRGVLVPLELAKWIPFKIARFFWVFNVPTGQMRGAHAHKLCNQYLICAFGLVHVDVHDGFSERTIALAAGQALHVPPGLFTAERYETSNSILMVFCDRPYEPEDYLNDRDTFLTYRRSKNQQR